MYVQLPQHLQHGREHQSVALQFDDDQWSHVTVFAGKQIVELQLGVDGEPLRLGIVHERHPVEEVVGVCL